MKPIFEIIDENKHYKIYENGQIEGFGANAIIFNRLPAIYEPKILKELEEIKNTVSKKPEFKFPQCGSAT